MHRTPFLLRLFFIMATMLLCPFCATAQVASWEDYLMDVIDIDEYDETELSEMYEHLAELEEQPLNINTATYDDLCEIPGLTQDQISDIMFYRDKYGTIRSMEELALISSIDRPMRLFLSQLFYASQPNTTGGIDWTKWYRGAALDSLLHHGHGSVLVSGSIPLYTRMGYEDGYLGDKYKYNLKIKGKFNEFITYGFTEAKDAGEPLFKNGNEQGFDFYSGFVNINKIGIMKSLVLGRYRLKMGQGLIINNGFSLGKQYMLSNIGDGATRLTGHSSRSDSHFLQGAAITFANNNSPSTTRNSILEATLFWSYRKIDATLNDDGTVSTLLTSGYHRTQSEMDKKNNTGELMWGGHIMWKHNGWHAGMTGVYTWYNRDLNPSETQLYRRYYPRGGAFWNASVDYGYLSRRITFQGETATGDCGNIATLNMLTALLPHEIRLTAVQRYYSYQYHAPLANAFSDGGYVQNESGIYLGLQMPLLKKLKLEAYTDYAYFPWAKYYTALNEGLSCSSHSWDNNISLTYDIRKWSLMCRYRLRMRQRHNSDKTALLPRNENTFRLSATRTSGVWSHRTQIDYRITTFNNETSRGYMLSQMVSWKPGKVFSASLSGGYFNATSNDTRLYMYERGLLESFSMSSFSGEGFRISGVARADLSKHWMAMCKVGFTNYLDRATISTGYQEIPQSYKTDIDLQIRYKF